MALHSRDAVTVYAAVATRSRTDCSSMGGHTSLSTALVSVLFLRIAPPLIQILLFRSAPPVDTKPSI